MTISLQKNNGREERNVTSGIYRSKKERRPSGLRRLVSLFEQSFGSQFPLSLQFRFPEAGEISPARMRAACACTGTVIAVFAVSQADVAVVAACFVSHRK